MPPAAGGNQARRRFGLQVSAFLLLPPAASFRSGDRPGGVPRGTPLVYDLTLEEVLPAPH